MKKILALLFVFIFSFGLTSAHPGRTDSSGCHTCRTNCAKWGLSNGQYHCHNSKGVSQPLPQVTSSSIKNTTYYKDTNQIYSTNNNTKDMNSVCNFKYNGTVYRASDDKCICENGVEWNKITFCNNNSSSYNISETFMNEMNQTCNIKYAETVYRLSDDKCICANGREWNTETNCSLIPKLKDF